MTKTDVVVVLLHPSSFNPFLRVILFVAAQCVRSTGCVAVWPDGYIFMLNIWPFTAIKICLIAKNWPKYDPNAKPLKVTQRL